MLQPVRSGGRHKKKENRETPLIPIFLFFISLPISTFSRGQGQNRTPQKTSGAGWRRAAFQVGPNFKIILLSNDFLFPNCRSVRIGARVTTNGCHVTSVTKLVDYVANIQIRIEECSGLPGRRRNDGTIFYSRLLSGNKKYLTQLNEFCLVSPTT
jgi:hypothetical protein